MKEAGLKKYKNELVAAMIIFAFFVIAKNVWSSQESKIMRIAQRKTEIEDKREMSELWDKTENDYKEVVSKFIRMDTITFKSFVEKQANKYGFNIVQMRPFQADQGDLIEARIVMVFTAPYPDIAKFISSVEAENIKVESLVVRNKDKLAELTLKGFILKK